MNGYTLMSTVGASITLPRYKKGLLERTSVDELKTYTTY